METVKGKPSLEDELQVHLDRISVIRKELSARENYKKESYKGRYFLIGKGRVFKIKEVIGFDKPNGSCMDCRGLMVSADNPQLLAVDFDAKERIDLSTHVQISEGDFALKVIDAIDLIKKATPMLNGPAEHLGGILGSIVTPSKNQTDLSDDVIDWSKQMPSSSAKTFPELLKEMDKTVPSLGRFLEGRVSPLKDGRSAIENAIQRDWDMIGKNLREAGDKASNKMKMDFYKNTPMVSNISKTLAELWKERFGQDLTDEKFAELAAMIPEQPKDPSQMEIDFGPKVNFDKLISWLLSKYEISYFHAEDLLKRSKRVTLQDGTTVIAIDESGIKPRNNGYKDKDS